ncbi:hypothetical protein TNCV_2802851 [Trichonephila clavipes]|nr:hypothetical protein TNCV_2802851 [Trichonephila clavipes]
MARDRYRRRSRSRSRSSSGSLDRTRSRRSRSRERRRRSRERRSRTPERFRRSRSRDRRRVDPSQAHCLATKFLAIKVYNMATLPDCPVQWLTYGNPKTGQAKKSGKKWTSSIFALDPAATRRVVHPCSYFLPHVFRFLA